MRSVSYIATVPAEAAQPDPNRALPARLGPAGTLKILRLLDTLVAYGRNLAALLRQHDDPGVLPWFAFAAGIFGTTNPALITVLITRGLIRAAGLQARLLAILGGENRTATRIAGGSRSPREPRAAAWLASPDWPAIYPSLDRPLTIEQETAAEIAVEDHDRPIGAILLDICLDFGIVPALMEPATWDELRLALTLYGGDPTPLEARGIASADPAAGRKSEALSATGTPGPIVATPPWPTPQQEPPPLAGGGWGRGPGP